MTKSLSDEEKRICELKKYQILDTVGEESYQDLVDLASLICNTPISLISLVDEHRQWFKARVGLNVQETERNLAFCNYVISGRKPVLVEDALRDPRFASNQLVVGDPWIRFYAGVPLVSDSFILGSLCVIDTKPRTFSEQSMRALEALARQVMAQLQLRLTLSELRVSQKKADSESQHYLRLVNSLKEAVFEVDEDFKWSFLSSVWQQISGYSSEETLNHHFETHIFSADQSRVLEFLKGQMTARQTERCEFRYEHKDGSQRWLEVFAKGNFDANGEPLGASGTIADITERKFQEETIENQKIKIIHSARLYSLGEMAAGIAHEINNPLAIIRGTVQLLLKDLEKGEINFANSKDAIAKIDSTVSRIAKIISGLRFFGRDGGNDPFTSISVNTLISDTLDLGKTRFEKHGIRIEVITAAPDIQLECRPNQISQALWKILGNSFEAVQAMDKKIVRIQAIDNKENVEIKVSDSGPGIPIEIENKIMNPFFSTKSPQTAMGLGLSIAQGLVQNHHGNISFQKEENMTCFTVRLPKIQPKPNFEKAVSQGEKNV